MSSSKEITLENQIDKVVVFLDGARVFRTGKVELKKGFQQVRVAGLTKNLIKDSVRVSGKGKGSLGAIDVETLYHEEVVHEALKKLMQEEQKLLKKLATLQEKAAFAAHQKDQLKILGDRFATEFPLWLASGEAKLSTLSDFTDFEAKQSEENLTLRRKLADEIETLNKKIMTIRAEIGDYQNQSRVEQTTDIVIGIDAAATGPFIFEISYQATGVSWEPSYDVELGTEQALVKGLAQIRNRTLEDWIKVDLEISTAVFKPIQVTEPNPFYIDVYEPQPYTGAIRGTGGLASVADGELLERVDKAKAAPPAPVEEKEEEIEDLFVEEAVIQESPAGVQSYTIPGKWTIPSDGNKHPVTLVTYELSTKKQFYWCASDPLSVIAQDKITNGDAVLLAGKAKVYSEGEFIGETFIEQTAPREDFELGAREELKMKAEKKLLSRVKEKAGIVRGKRTIDYHYELSIKNFRKEDSEITVKDVIPYSQSERIKVKWLECNLEHEEDNLGVYTWKLKIKPDGEAKITYRYQVSWEKDYTLSPPLP